MENKDAVRQQYDVEASYYDDIYSGEVYPADVFRRDFVVDRLTNDDSIETVLDIGCGTGVTLLPLLEAGLDAEGFDFSEKMLEEAREKLRDAGFDTDRARKGDLTEGIPGEKQYDAVVALGVLPHFEDLVPPLSTIRERVADDGEIWVQLRNDLFDLFTLNEYSYEFFQDELLDDVDLSPSADAALEQRFRDACGLSGANAEVNPRQNGNASVDNEKFEHPSYQHFHNPLTVSSAFSDAEFEVEDLYWFHYHAMPPEFEEKFEEEFVEQSLALEDPTDWRGHFLASVFMVEASAA